jgi:hypothetical protein
LHRFPRLFLAAALLLVTLGRPVPAAAVSAGCSTLGADGRPLGAGQLFVQAAYGSSEVIVFRFYIQGPETRTVYEGNDPDSFGIYLSSLAPGTYRWMLHSTYDVGDGTTIEATETLATCTVSGLVDVPPLKGKTQGAAAETLAAAGLSLGAISSASSATVAKGEVISQRPSAGSDVALGSTVVITISTGPAPATPTPTPTPKPVATPEPSATPVDPVAEVTLTPSVTPAPVTTASPTPTESPVLAASSEPPSESGSALVALAATLPLWVIALLVVLRRARR